MDAVDIAIVGGGPAGLTTALSLVAAAPDAVGRLVVLEKATYPRDKICAGAIGDRGWNILQALDAAPDVPHVRVHGIQLDTGCASMVARPGDIGRVVRRLVFDAALADIAYQRGVHIETGCAVSGMSVDESGVTVTTSKGPLRAQVVVGADGVGSVVRRAMGHSVGRLRAMVVELDTGPAPGDPPRDTLRFDARQPDLPGYYWDFPTLVDGHPLWCRGLYLLRVADGARPGMAPADHINLRDRLDAWMASRGLSRADFANKRFSERGWEPSVEPALGPLLLVGESMGIDPISGEGIAQAIESGRDLGRFLAAGSLDRTHLARWTATHRRSRLGRDLAVRTRMVRPAYGPPRAWLEALLAGNTHLLAAGCHHWAGRVPPLGTVLSGLGQATWRQISGGARPALSAAVAMRGLVVPWAPVLARNELAVVVVAAAAVGGSGRLTSDGYALAERLGCHLRGRTDGVVVGPELGPRLTARPLGPVTADVDLAAPGRLLRGGAGGRRATAALERLRGQYGGGDLVVVVVQPMVLRGLVAALAGSKPRRSRLPVATCCRTFSWSEAEGWRLDPAAWLPA